MVSGKALVQRRWENDSEMHVRETAERFDCINKVLFDELTDNTERLMKDVSSITNSRER